jgi:hypothetical protein
MTDSVVQRAFVVGLLVASAALTVMTFVSALRVGPRTAEASTAPVASSRASTNEAASPEPSEQATEGSAAADAPTDAPSVPAEPDRVQAARAPSILEGPDPTPSSARPSPSDEDGLAEPARLARVIAAPVPDGPPAPEPTVDGSAPGDAFWRRRPTREEPCTFAVRTIVVARSIRSREPQRTEGPYEANGEPLYLYMEVFNDSGQRARARARFVHTDSGETVLGTADIGISSRWRTWIDFVTPPGRLGGWTVQIIDDDRCLAAEHPFEMIPPGWN